MMMHRKSDRRDYLRMEFRRFLNTIILIPAMVTRRARGITIRLIGYTPAIDRLFSVLPPNAPASADPPPATDLRTLDTTGADRQRNRQGDSPCSDTDNPARRGSKYRHSLPTRPPSQSTRPSRRAAGGHHRSPAPSWPDPRRDQPADNARRSDTLI